MCHSSAPLPVFQRTHPPQGGDRGSGDQLLDAAVPRRGFGLCQTAAASPVLRRSRGKSGLSETRCENVSRCAGVRVVPALPARRLSPPRWRRDRWRCRRSCPPGPRRACAGRLRAGGRLTGPTTAPSPWPIPCERSHGDREEVAGLLPSPVAYGMLLALGLLRGLTQRRLVLHQTLTGSKPFAGGRCLRLPTTLLRQEGEPRGSRSTRDARRHGPHEH